LRSARRQDQEVSTLDINVHHVDVPVQRVLPGAHQPRDRDTAAGARLLSDRYVDGGPVLPSNKRVLIAVQDAVVDHVDARLARGQSHLATVVN